MANASKLEPKDFIFFSRPNTGKGKTSIEESGLIGKSLEQIEKTIIEGTLRSNKGNKMATAKTLGIALLHALRKNQKIQYRKLSLGHS